MREIVKRERKITIEKSEKGKERKNNNERKEIVRKNNDLKSEKEKREKEK